MNTRHFVSNNQKVFAFIDSPYVNGNALLSIFFESLPTKKQITAINKLFADNGYAAEFIKDSQQEGSPLALQALADNGNWYISTIRKPHTCYHTYEIVPA